MKYLIYLLLPVLFLTGCEKNIKTADDHHDEHEGDLEHIHITARQAAALKFDMDSLRHRDMGNSVEASGQLKVPPKNEAVITGMMGANIKSIEVRQGAEVKQGQVLAYLSHPDMLDLQSAYRKAHDEMMYLEKEYQRQKRLYEEGVAAGMIFQQAEKNYSSTKEHTKALASQLRLLNLNPGAIQSGRIFEQIPIISPINGFVQEINVRTGQFVEPQAVLFEVVNPEEIYADLRIYEKDAHSIEEGQWVDLHLPSSQMEVRAKVFSVGKSFESASRSIHVLAEIDAPGAKLFPGTFVKARIRSEEQSVTAFPESAIVEVENKTYVFSGFKEANGDWEFSAEEVKINSTEDGWSSVVFLRDLPMQTLFAFNNAYYLLAEALKGMGGHDH